MKRAAAILALSAGLAAAPSAYADAIDGEWCSANGQTVMIDGPSIRIPSGATLQGRYDRHAFAYEAPPGDPEAGLIVYMELLGEEAMRVYRIKDGKPDDGEVWNRCNVTS